MTALLLLALLAADVAPQWEPPPMAPDAPVVVAPPRPLAPVPLPPLQEPLASPPAAPSGSSSSSSLSPGPLQLHLGEAALGALGALGGHALGMGICMGSTLFLINAFDTTVGGGGDGLGTAFLTLGASLGILVGAAVWVVAPPILGAWAASRMGPEEDGALGRAMLGALVGDAVGVTAGLLTYAVGITLTLGIFQTVQGTQFGPLSVGALLPIGAAALVDSLFIGTGAMVGHRFRPSGSSSETFAPPKPSPLAPPPPPSAVNAPPPPTTMWVPLLSVPLG